MSITLDKFYMKNTSEMKFAARAFAMCVVVVFVSITSSIYTRFLYTFSHIPFLTFFPSASSSVNRLSDVIASNNSSSAAVFRITSDIMFDTMNSMDLKITEVVKE